MMERGEKEDDDDGGTFGRWQQWRWKLRPMTTMMEKVTEGGNGGRGNCG